VTQQRRCCGSGQRKKKYSSTSTIAGTPSSQPMKYLPMTRSFSWLMRQHCLLAA
jgi:hypothetical protein